MLRLLIDENIPFARKTFAEFGEVELIPGRTITNSMLRNVDVLIVRSVTKVNAALLDGTRIRFVGTATIGIDHVDVAHLRNKNICFAHAAGSNANSVAEYVVAAALHHACERKLRLRNLTIGVVGVGHIGSIVVRYAEALGLRVLPTDPPRQRAEQVSSFLTLDELMDADIISIHTPLTLAGIDTTYHLFDARRLAHLKEGCLLINTARGAVVETSALKDAIHDRGLAAYLDVWENEPVIDGELLHRVEIGTPHIAGYSLDGKINGTQRIYEALCTFLDRQPQWKLDTTGIHHPAQSRISIPQLKTTEETLRHVVRAAYDIGVDNEKLKRAITYSARDRGRHFDELRAKYPVRREFSSHEITSENLDEEVIGKLRALGFRIV